MSSGRGGGKEDDRTALTGEESYEGRLSLLEGEGVLGSQVTRAVQEWLNSNDKHSGGGN